MKTQVKQTSNVSSRKIKPEGIVIHHTAGSYEGSVSWCLNPKSRVSYHVIVDTNGDKTILAEDTQRAWHAGKSSFKGKSDCNSFMLGIAVSGNTNNRELTDKEVESVVCWCMNKMSIWGFGLEQITTHREVSPGRKNDVDVRAEERIKNEIKKLV